MASSSEVIQCVQEYIDECALDYYTSTNLFLYKLSVKKDDYFYVEINYNSFKTQEGDLNYSSSIVLLKVKFSIISDAYDNDTFNEFLELHLFDKLPILKDKKLISTSSKVVFKIGNELDYTLNSYETTEFMTALLIKQIANPPIKSNYYLQTIKNRSTSQSSDLYYIPTLSASNLCQEVEFPWTI